MGLVFEGVDITDDINDLFLSLKYTDNADEADDLQIVLADMDNTVIGEWLNTELEGRDKANMAETGGTTTASSGTAGSEAGEIYSVTANSGLRYRAGPGTSYDILGTASHGTKVTVYEQTNGWGRVIYNGETAYMSMNYLSSTGEKVAAVEATSPANAEAETACKKAILAATIVKQNWAGDGKDEILECGTFQLDTVKMKGPPQTVTLKATSLEYSSSLRQNERSRAWENITLQGIAEAMGRESGYKVMYSSRFNPHYTRREQVQQSDIAFLQSLCNDSAVGLKVSNMTIVLYDRAQYEEQDPALVIQRGDASYNKYDFDTTLPLTAYSACEVSYTDPDTEETIEYTFTPPGFVYDEDNVLKVGDEVHSVAEAKELAIRRLRVANKGETTATFDMPGNVGLVSGLTVELQGFGAYDGKYLVESAAHSVDKKNSYTTRIDIYKVIEGY